MGENQAFNHSDDRAKTYSFLASLCLKPPSDDLVSMIRDGSILKQLKRGGFGSGYHELERFVKEKAGLPDLINELTAEHSMLFLLPADVLPQEAFYLDEKKRMGGSVTTGVGKFYQAAGAEIMKECVEMPDHFGVELQFMEFLCKLETELSHNDDKGKLEQCLELQNRFLNEHLLKWAFQCCEKIIEVTKLGFYKAVAYFIIEFLESEREHIAGAQAKSVKMETSDAR